MPELPEVETTRRGIAPYLTGQVIRALHVHQPRLRWPVPTELTQALEGQAATAVERRAKYLLVHFEHGTLIVHLGMSGSLRLAAHDTPRLTHDHIELDLGEAGVLRYNDPRRFGAWLWSNDWERHPLLAALGPEPLSDDFDGHWLYRLAKGRRMPVKPFLMDGHVVVGVGNIYATEALFLAGIDPRRHAGNVSLKRFECLAGDVKRVLSAAIELGGTTLRDFVNADGKPGYFQQTLNVYGRAGEPCRRCAEPLKQVSLGQRTTTWCPRCQH